MNSGTTPRVWPDKVIVLSPQRPTFSAANTPPAMPSGTTIRRFAASFSEFASASPTNGPTAERKT